MTREEAIKELKEDIELYIPLRGTIDDVDRDLPDGRLITALEMAIKALEQEPFEDELYDFANWVAEEIFDENWEYNKDAFAELACRKLAILGMVRANGDEWELVEPQESEDKE